MDIIFLIYLALLSSCSKPFDKKSNLVFHDIKQEEQNLLRRHEEQLRASELVQIEFEKEKKRAMEEIISEAKSSFEIIRPMITTKCFGCHNSTTKLPIYGRIFRGINPVAHHQRDGLRALDFSDVYPLKALGNPSQISLLKALRNSAIERNMPIKAYRTIYPSRKIFDKDEDMILGWVDPIIAKIEEYNEKYEPISSDPTVEAIKVMNLKCFRCHANGNARGGFGDMEDNSKLLASKFVSLKDPLNSVIYTISEKGEMPPSKQETLTEKDLSALKEWLILESQRK